MAQTHLPTGNARRHDAVTRRDMAAALVAQLPILEPVSNGDEDRFATSQPASFTKGLHHDGFGLVKRSDYETFRAALIKGDREMAGLTIAAGGDPRTWESPLAGVYFNDVGADPDAVAMAPAPKLGSSELVAEMASVYAMALTRDIPFEDLQKEDTVIPGLTTAGEPVTVGDLVAALRKLSWFDPTATPNGVLGEGLTAHEQRRRAAAWECAESGLTVNVLFRGSTKGAKQGPYLSQFMLIGTDDLSDPMVTSAAPEDGNISYGLQKTSQAQLIPEPGVDYMTTWDDWLEVQQGTSYDQPPHNQSRRIHTPRDLAGYVHFDALYQAYLNACLILIANNAAVDEGNPIASARASTSQGFATWGGPHILSLVTEVATRGLRAARRTKFQVHRRARPEVLAARLAQVASGHIGTMDPLAQTQTETMLRDLGFDLGSRCAAPGTILDWIAQHNAAQNTGTPAGPIEAGHNFLLPMAFIEGSPMHPAYGAGHATVAGACVTILKAFYQSDALYQDVVAGGATFYAANSANRLVPSCREDGAQATIAEELDKLAANISIGRNIAGVHYYSDYYDSLRMGERIAVSILEEQMYTYHERVELRLTSFDGDEIVLKTTGDKGPGAVTMTVNGTADKTAWWIRDVEEYQPSDPSSLELLA